MIHPLHAGIIPLRKEGRAINRFWRTLITGSLIGAGLSVLMMSRTSAGREVVREEAVRHGPVGSVRRVTRAASRVRTTTNPATSAVRSVVRRFGIGHE